MVRTGTDLVSATTVLVSAFTFCGVKRGAAVTVVAGAVQVSVTLLSSAFT